MKLTILGVDVECEDKIIYATKKLSKEYIKSMKDTNGKTITEEEFMKGIGHGVERTMNEKAVKYGTLDIQQIEKIDRLLAEQKKELVENERRFIKIINNLK